MIDALPLLLGPEGYQISRSVRLRNSASAYLNRTFGSNGNQQQWTWSGWTKAGRFGSQQPIFCAYSNTQNYGLFTFSANAFISATDTLKFYTTISNVGQAALETAAVFRDPSAWYHVVLQVDTTQATSTNRIRIYVNGVLQTLTGTQPSQNANLGFFNTTSVPHQIGALATGTYGYYDGYLTEVNFIDGQALTPSSFGETNLVTGVWQPKKYTGTYGTNGFYLNFSDNSNNTATTIGKDYSGNGNNWTPNNISVTAGATYDSMLDVPTQWADGGNGRGNYCTLLPTAAGSLVTLSNGNLTVTGNSASNSAVALSSIAVTSGLWYFENTITTVGGISYIGFGRVNSGYNDLNNAESFTNTNNYGGAYRNSGDVFGFGRTISSTSTFTTGDVLGLALDMDNGAAYVSKNGTFLNSGVPTSGSSKTGALFTWTAGSQTICPLGGGYNGSVNNFNFGQRPFSYTPPTGFKALNTLNLPAPTILKGNQYFDVALATGANLETAINALAPTKDLRWVKNRSTGGTGHVIWDSQRGATARLDSSDTAAESTFNYSNLVQGDNHVGWVWQEGPTQGFDIVTYTGNATAGRTVSHSLGAAPVFIVTKRRDSTSNWWVYSKALNDTGSTGWLYLNLTSSRQTTANAADDPYFKTAPTSSVFSIAGDGINVNTATYVSYLFSEVAGFSKAFSYTGNGSADGPFVFCGFRPRFIMVKRTDAAGANWSIYDTARDVSNVAQLELYPNASTAETTSANARDFLSNGFKLRTTDTWQNASGGTYIGFAWAESPFKFALGR
jgi:hypothetical protein